MTLRVMHLANFGSRNIGNAALILGAERVLEEDISRPLTFSAEPWDLYTRGLRAFDEEFVERVNAESDVLLIGGAITFDGSGWYRETGFRFSLPFHLWDKIERPIVLYGVSHRSWPRRAYVHREPLRQSLERMVTDERFLFAARNDGTKAFLEEILGRTTDRIREIPDVAVFVPTEDVHHPEIDPDRTNLIVAPNAEDEPERWGRSRRQRALRRPLRDQGLRGLVPVTSSWGWAERRNEFVGALAGALGRIAADRPTNVILCAHDPADVGMCWDIYSRLPEAARFDVSFTAASLPVSAGRRFYDLYRKADAAISMRIHSMNPAVGLGTPVVPLVSQRRMSAFMQDAGLTELTVDLHGGDIERRIHAATQRALDDGDAVRTRLRGAVDRLRDEVRAVNADIDAFLR